MEKCFKKNNMNNIEYKFLKFYSGYNLDIFFLNIYLSN